MTPAEQLRAAAALLREKGWTRHAYARDAEGARVYPTSETAVCFCAAGALMRVAGEDDSIPTAPWYALRRVHRFSDSFLFNDAPGRTAEEVIAALEKAAESLEAGT